MMVLRMSGKTQILLYRVLVSSLCGSSSAAIRNNKGDNQYLFKGFNDS